MHRHTSAILAAILVAGLMGATTADAVKRYDWRVCPGPNDQCEGAWVVHPQHVQPGETFTVHVDFDEIAPGPIYATEFWVLYQPGQVTFRDAQREQVDPGSPASCHSGENTGSYLPVGCPDCVAEVHCVMADWLLNGGLDIVSPAEVELEFTVNMENNTSRVTMIAPDWFYPRDENDYDMNGPGDGITTGPAGVVVRVPEPGEMAMLAAGLPLLALFARCRRRQG